MYLLERFVFHKKKKQVEDEIDMLATDAVLHQTSGEVIVDLKDLSH